MKKTNYNNNTNTNASMKRAPMTKAKSLKGPFVKVNKTNDKNELKKEIAERNLPLIDHYTKDLIDINIKIDDDNNTTNHPSNKEPKASSSIRPFIQQLKPKQDDEIIKKSIVKIEKMYITCVKNTESMKLSDSLSTEELLKQEVIYLKTKNEVLRLKADFFENIFFTSKNIIETYQMQSELKDKLIGVFTQNNNHYYESFNFLHKKQFDIFSIEKCTDNDQMINKKCLNVINSIEDNLLMILKDIQLLIKAIGIDNTQQSCSSSSSVLLLKLKDHIISSTKQILSYYALSDNYCFDFKAKNTFWINNTDEYIKYDSNKRTTKLIEEFKALVDPMLNKVMTKKHKNEMINYFGSLCSFYENFNQVLINENYHLKCFNTSTLQRLNSQNEKMQKVIDDYITSSKESVIKLTEITEFLFNNQSKNVEKVLYSLMNTEKDKMKNMLTSYNYFIGQYMLIK